MAQGIRRAAITPDVVNTHLREDNGPSAMTNEGGNSFGNQKILKRQKLTTELNRMADDGCPNSGFDRGFRK